MATDVRLINGLLLAPGEGVPEMGNIECIKREPDGRVIFHGLSSDLDKLLALKQRSIAGGSSCIMEDTGEEYVFNARTKQWTLRENSGSVGTGDGIGIDTSTNSIRVMSKGEFVGEGISLETLSSDLDPEVKVVM